MRQVIVIAIGAAVLALSACAVYETPPAGYGYAEPGYYYVPGYYYGPAYPHGSYHGRYWR